MSITSIYKCQKFNRWIAKRFLREKLRRDIGVRFFIFFRTKDQKFSILISVCHRWVTVT